MTPAELSRRLRGWLGALGAPGLIIGALSLLSFGFGLIVLADERHQPSQVGQSAIRGVFHRWARLDDYLGYTLVDRANRWRSADALDREAARQFLGRAIDDLGSALARDDARFRLVNVGALDLIAGDDRLASWKSPSPPNPPEPGRDDDSTDRIELVAAEGDRPGVDLVVRYRLVDEMSRGLAAVESSYRRLTLALLGLSGYSLLCLAYMASHARNQRERIAREAADAATLALADRTCHELGNVAFTVANERQNLSGHLDLIDRFVAEEPESVGEAARRSGLDLDVARKLHRALRREYADRGIDPDLDLKGSAAIAREVCRQIATCSGYIGLMVEELDGHLRRSALPTLVEPVELSGAIEEALTLIAPRLESSGAKVAVPDSSATVGWAMADRRHLILALVNLIKNAVEAGSKGPGSEARRPEIRILVSSSGTDRVEVSVADDGPGIAPAELRRVFEAGYSTKGTGRGLGLSIVRESVEAMGGTLRASSEPGRGGATFSISLPVAPRSA